MTEKIYLGRLTNNHQVWLEKHKWNCEWYWAFGYIGNRNLYMHIESLIKHPEKYNPNWTNISEHFSETWLTQDQWWILRDLFIQAYALKKAAETYAYGGHQTESAKPYRITNPERAAEINSDLKSVLDNIWTLLTEWKTDK